MSGEEARGNMETVTPTPELRARFDAAGGKPVYVRRMFGRIALERDEINILRGMISFFEKPLAQRRARTMEVEPPQSPLDS